MIVVGVAGFVEAIALQPVAFALLATTPADGPLGALGFLALEDASMEGVQEGTENLYNGITGSSDEVVIGGQTF